MEGPNISLATAIVHSSSSMLGSGVASHGSALFWLKVLDDELLQQETEMTL